MSIFTPPTTSAGKSFTVVRPRPRAASTSVGVAQPGYTGTWFFRHHSTTSRLVPGEMTAFAPQSTASLACSTLSTVPAQTNISGRAAAIFSMDLAAAGVRKVTSAAGMPPSSKAWPRGTAFPSSSSWITGMTPVFRKTCSTFSIEIPSFLAVVNPYSRPSWERQRFL